MDYQKDEGSIELRASEAWPTVLLPERAPSFPAANKTQGIVLSMSKSRSFIYQDHRDMAESIVGLAYVRQTTVVQKNLLQNESGHGFA